MSEQMILSTATGLALSDEINRAHDAVVSSLNDAVTHATECGRLLLDAKTQCKHGEWLPWLEQNFKGSQRTATNYMRLETAKRQRIADLGHDDDQQFTSINEALRAISCGEGKPRNDKPVDGIDWLRTYGVDVDDWDELMEPSFYESIYKPLRAVKVCSDSESEMAAMMFLPKFIELESFVRIVRRGIEVGTLPQTVKMTAVGLSGLGEQ